MALEGRVEGAAFCFFSKMLHHTDICTFKCDQFGGKLTLIVIFLSCRRAGAALLGTSTAFSFHDFCLPCLAPLTDSGSWFSPTSPPNQTSSEESLQGIKKSRKLVEIQSMQRPNRIEHLRRLTALLSLRSTSWLRWPSPVSRPPTPFPTCPITRTRSFIAPRSIGETGGSSPRRFLRPSRSSTTAPVGPAAGRQLSGWTTLGQPHDDVIHSSA